MREYARVAPQFWTRGSGKRLRGDSDAQVLAMYVVTCPAANMIGIYYVPFVSIAYETGLGEKRTRAALSRLETAGFAFYDDDAEVVWVPNMASYQLGDALGGEGDKRRKGVLAEIEKVGGHKFVDLFFEQYAKGYGLTPSTPSKGSPTTDTTPSEGKLDPSEEAAQAHAQAASQSTATPSGVIPKTRSSRATRLLDDWQPKESDLEALRRKLGVEPLACVDEFRDYWRSVAGQRGTKLDWDATFRNRVRDKAELGKLPKWHPPEFTEDGTPIFRSKDREKYIPKDGETAGEYLMRKNSEVQV